MNIRFLIASTLLVVTGALHAGHHEQGPSFSTTPVRANIDMLSGKGGNIGVLKGPDGILLIDDDYADMSPALKMALKAYGGLENVTYLINTHWHGDHTGGNELIGPHALIVAHDKVRERLSKPQEVKLFNMKSDAYPESALPEITYSRSMTLHFGGETVELLHLPNGHTDTDTVVFFKNANVVHLGDLYFSGGFPFVDVDSNGNVLRVAKNLRKILHRIDDDTKIIPGHGPLSAKSDLQNTLNMIVGTTAEVRALKAAGMTLEQIQEQGFSALWDSWDNKFLPAKAWISIIYSSLEAKHKAHHGKRGHHGKHHRYCKEKDCKH